MRAVRWVLVSEDKQRGEIPGTLTFRRKRGQETGKRVFFFVYFLKNNILYKNRSICKTIS